MMISTQQRPRPLKILLYTMNWYPFEGSMQHIYGTVLRYFKEKGYEVTVLTSIPYFMNAQEGKWQFYKGKIFTTEWSEGIKTVRTFVLSCFCLRSRKILLRFINGISFSLTSLLAGMFVRKPDVMVTVSHPPLLIGIVSFFISRIRRCEYIYCLEDIYPDILVDTGVIKKGWVLNLLRKIELFIYKKAKKVCVLSAQMALNLSTKGISPHAIELIPHFADLERITPLAKQNLIAKEYNLDSKFVVLLPGSISYRYDVDTIFESAKLLSINQDIEFVFIERGELKDIFRKKVTSQKLENIKFLPFQPLHKFPQVLASADVCLVSLQKEVAAYSLPSKVYNIMASGRPVIAITSSDSDLARIIEEAECGVCVPPKAAALLAQTIEELSGRSHVCERMGYNGRVFLEQHLHHDTICRQYERVIRDAHRITKHTQ